MKAVVSVLLAQIIFINCNVIPEHLPQPCKKTDPNYKSCALKAFDKVGPYLLKGVPEISIPKLEPLEIPYYKVNRTIGDLVSINAVLKDIKVSGLSKTYIDDLQIDLENKSGELKLIMPYMYLTMEYNVQGNVFAIPLRNKGFFRGNFTNTVTTFQGKLKLIEKEGVEYFAFDKFGVKSRVGDGYVKMTAKNPQYQFAADLISNFFNENPRRFLDAINPIYIETATEFYKQMLQEVLATIPAKELLPQ